MEKGMKETKPCPVCDGSGRDDFDNEKSCRACQGSGIAIEKQGL